MRTAPTRISAAARPRPPLGSGPTGSSGGGGAGSKRTTPSGFLSGRGPGRPEAGESGISARRPVHGRRLVSVVVDTGDYYHLRCNPVPQVVGPGGIDGECNVDGVVRGVSIGLARNHDDLRDVPIAVVEGELSHA